MSGSVAMGYPTDPQLRAALEGLVHQPIPVYADAARDKCSGCDMEIEIGPRSYALVEAGTARPICVFCATAMALVQGINVINLGNEPIKEEAEL